MAHIHMCWRNTHTHRTKQSNNKSFKKIDKYSKRDSKQEGHMRKWFQQTISLGLIGKIIWVLTVIAWTQGWNF